MIRHVSKVVKITTTDLTSIYKIPDTRLGKLKKLMITNLDSSANTIIFYDGDSRQVLPTIYLPGEFTRIYGENELPSVELWIELKAKLGTAPTNGVEVVAEIEEEGA